MALSILQEFNIKLDIHFYDVDTKIIESLKLTIEAKEREKREKSSAEDTSGYNGGSVTVSPQSLEKKGPHAAKVEFQTEDKKLVEWLDIRDRTG